MCITSSDLILAFSRLFSQFLGQFLDDEVDSLTDDKNRIEHCPEFAAFLPLQQVIWYDPLILNAIEVAASGLMPHVTSQEAQVQATPLKACANITGAATLASEDKASATICHSSTRKTNCLGH